MFWGNKLQAGINIALEVPKHSPRGTWGWTALSNSISRSSPSRMYYFLKMILLERTPLVNVFVCSISQSPFPALKRKKNPLTLIRPRKWTPEVQTQTQSEMWQCLCWLTVKPFGELFVHNSLFSTKLTGPRLTFSSWIIKNNFWWQTTTIFGV